MKKSLLFICILCNFAYSQSNSTLNTYAPNTTPMAPDAYSLFKYTEIPVSLTTGVTSISIPIYSIKLKTFELPISIDYHSAGIKTDEIATNAGLGWTLKAGGMISNQVFGRDDWQSGHNYATSINKIPQKRELDPRSGNPGACTDDYNDDYFKLRRILEGDWDMEPDIFYYSYGNENGKFFFSADTTISEVTANPIPFKPIKIKRSIGQYDIVDEKGNTFTYDQYGITYSDPAVFTTNGTYIYNRCETGGGHETLNFGTNTSENQSYNYYLTKVKNIYGEEITLDYEDEIYQYKIRDEYVRYKSTQTLLLGQPFPTAVENTIKTIITVRGKRIKKISSNNGDEVSFNYNAYIRLDLPKDDTNISNIPMTGANALQNIKVKRGSTVDSYQLSHTYFDAASTVNQNLNNITGNSRYSYRLKLDSIKKNSDPASVFSYYNPTSLPDILSNNFDHFGYQSNTGSKYPLDYRYNFTDGVSRDPDLSSTVNGTLKSIQYPTGGKSQFEYELNNFYGSITNYTPSASFGSTLILTGYEGADPPNYKSTELTSTVTIPSDVLSGSIELTTHNTSTSLTQTATQRIDMSITNTATNTAVSFTYPLGNKTSTLDINPGTYKLRVYGNLEGSGLVLTWMTKPTESQLTGNFNTGGLRIKSIRNFDTNASNSSSGKAYEYVDATDITKSSGKVLRQPQYTYFMSKRAAWCQECGGQITYSDNGYYVQKSTNIQPLNGMQGYHVMYTNVKEYNSLGKTNGYTQSAFSFADDIETSFQKFPPAPNTSLDFLRGNLIERKEFSYDATSATYKLIKTINNEYQYNYNQDISYDIFAQPNTPNEKHALGVVFDLVNMEKTCSSGLICSRLDLVCNLIYYKLISPWVYLKKSTESLVDLQSGLSTSVETNYLYENPTHGQVTKITTTNSSGKVSTKKFYYPHDLLSAGIMTTEMSKLIEQNRIAEQVKVVNSIENNSSTTKVSETFTRYGENESTANILVPTEIHSTLGSSETWPLADANCKIKYIKYDSNTDGTGNGNINEYELEDGVPVSIIWGYNKQYPIAKLEGIHYAAIPGDVITDLQTKSNSDNDNCAGQSGCNEAILRNALYALYSNTIFSKSLISTYTYNPQVGVTSMSDPRGLMTYYGYDDFSRLKETYIIEDNLKKVLQKYDYHYRNQ